MKEVQDIIEPFLVLMSEGVKETKHEDEVEEDDEDYGELEF